MLYKRLLMQEPFLFDTKELKTKQLKNLSLN